MLLWMNLIWLLLGYVTLKIGEFNIIKNFHFFGFLFSDSFLPLFLLDFPSPFILICPGLIQLSITSLSNLHSLPIRIAGIFPLAAFLQIVISWSFRYRDNSLVVMMWATGRSSDGKYVPMTVSGR